MTDSEHMRVAYEGIIKQNPSNVEAVHYLAVWHLERHSFQQARKYFGHLSTLRSDDVDVWFSLSVSSAMADEFEECSIALSKARSLVEKGADDVRVKFCNALMSEKRKEYPIALEGYLHCLGQCGVVLDNEHNNSTEISSDSYPISFMKELKGEVMLRIAVLRKETGAIDLAIIACDSIVRDNFGDSIKANALCLKGLLHEMRSEFPASEVVYRSALQILAGHSIALERLGRVYLRYRETIPAAVQCFFKSVETNPSNHVAWYLLGR
jgi:tetratricopeptide (TPR) repeat protein